MQIVPILLLSSVLIPTVSYACDCVVAKEPHVALQDSDAVFSGRVVEVRNDKNKQGVAISFVEFAVAEVWKGGTPATVTIQTAGDSAACGFSFATGQDYVVYAYNSDGGLTTNLCTRTSLRSAATEDITALGASMAPAPAPAPAGCDVSSEVTFSTGALFLMLLFSMGLTRRLSKI